jgi:anti-anti-sigma regulatory factor
MIATRNQMLRITRKANGEVVFKVSGQLNAENVAEMETLIAAETKGRRIVLDCTDLRSVDGEAVKFLEKWEADSIKLKNCGLYIREWIRRERLERESDQSRINEQQTGLAELSLCSRRSNYGYSNTIDP